MKMTQRNWVCLLGEKRLSIVVLLLNCPVIGKGSSMSWVWKFMMSFLMELVRLENVHYLMTVMGSESILHSVWFSMPSHQNQREKRNHLITMEVILSMSQRNSLLHYELHNSPHIQFPNYIINLSLYFYANYLKSPQTNILSRRSGLELCLR